MRMGVAAAQTAAARLEAATSGWGARPLNALNAIGRHVARRGRGRASSRFFVLFSVEETLNELRGIGWSKEAAEDALQHLFEALAVPRVFECL